MHGFNGFLESKVSVVIHALFSLKRVWYPSLRLHLSAEMHFVRSLSLLFPSVASFLRPPAISCPQLATQKTFTMKNPVLLLKIALLILVAAKTADILADLTLTQTQVEQVSMATAQKGLAIPAWNNYELYSFVKKAKALPAGAQAAAVKSLGAVVKAYVASGRFKSEWQAYVAGQALYNPRASGDYEKLAEIKKQAANQKTEMAESSKKMDASQAQMAKMLKENPQMVESMKSQMGKEEWAEMEKYLKGEDKIPSDNTGGDSRQVEETEKKLKEQQARYDNSQYPTMVKNRLENFIATATSVDFAAQVKTDKYGTKKFVNPDYERKSDFWKQLYRAGKEPVMAARDFAQQWRGELK